MAKAPGRTTDEDALRIGRAVARLRERRGMTQEAAAAAAQPQMTFQYWGMHERGQVPGIYKTERQRQLVQALDLTLQDLADELSGEADGDPGQDRLARMARELNGGDIKRAVFPLQDGEVVITLPANLTPAGFKQLSDYMAIFLRSSAPEGDA